MAKNYTFAEAVRIINAGTDMESITDIGRRYPILLHKVTKVATKAGEEFVDLMNFMPDHLTANKVNAALKNAIGDMPVAENADADEDLGESDENTTKPVKATKAAKAKDSEPSDSVNYESMSGKELWELLGQYGKRKDCKDKMGGAKKEDMIAYINKYGLAGEEAEDEAEIEENEAEETTENPYEGKSAMDLFKECKKRGIKAAPKKPAKYYAELLIKADEETTEDTESESDGWDDEEEVVEEPKKPAKKAEKEEKKPAKKPAKKEEAADEDDDWDI